MKAILGAFALFFLSHASAAQTYTFDCASDEAYIVVRVDGDLFNSSYKQIQGEIEIHSDRGSDVSTNAVVIDRALHTESGKFKLALSLGRSGSASMNGNFLAQTGGFKVNTTRNRISTTQAVCSFHDGSDI